MFKNEWVVYITSHIQNCFIMACFTWLAITFDKWWLVLISVVFIAMVHYSAEYKLINISREQMRTLMEKGQISKVYEVELNERESED